MTSEATGTPTENLSTEHQKEGDARLPSDTLDRPEDQVHEAREFTPGEDEGRAEPGD
jgi:hypothetical protein